MVDQRSGICKAGFHGGSQAVVSSLKNCADTITQAMLSHLPQSMLIQIAILISQSHSIEN